MNAETTFKTEQAQRYLGTLCKHFGHKVPVELDGNTGRIDLPFGQCELAVNGGALDMKVSAENKADLDKTAQIIASHLERFAFRENPQIEWQ